MQERYQKMIEDRVQNFIDKDEKFVKLTNIVNGKKEYF